MNRIISATGSRMLMPQSFLKLLFAIPLLICSIGIKAQIVTWTDAGASTDWYTPANWTPPTSAGGWLATNTAVFNNTGAATTAGINFSTSALSIGAVQATSARNRSLTIGNSSVGSGQLQLNGATVNGLSNVIISTAGVIPPFSLSFQNSTIGGASTMEIILGNPVNNIVYGGGAMGTVNISCPISGINKNLTLKGTASGGNLVLTGANTYTGVTRVDTRMGVITLNRPGGETLPPTNDVEIFDGKLDIKSNQTLRNVNLRSIAALSIADGVTLTITGTFTYNGGGVFLGAGGTGKIVYTTGASLVYDNSASTVGGNEFPAFYGPTNVTLTGLKTLSTTRAIGGTLTINGALLMGANDLTASAVAGGGRLVTNGTGKLNITNVGAAPVIFPVALATSGSYNPVTISNGQGLTYGVRVASGINPPGVLAPNNAVNRTWSITPAGPLSASPVNLAFYYTAGDGNPGFNYATPVDLGRFTTLWNVVQAGIAQIIPLPTAVAFMTPGVANTFVIGNVGAIH